MRSLALETAAPLLVALSLSVGTDPASASGVHRIIVHPGESIQAAVDQAQTGDVVAVLPGTYMEDGHPCPSDPSKTCAVSITTDGVRLVAARGRDLWPPVWRFFGLMASRSATGTAATLGDDGDDHGEQCDHGPGLGLGGVVIQAKGDQDRGVEVAKPGASGASCLTDESQRIRGVHLRGLEVDGFADDGIFLLCADAWEVRECATHDDLEYGIFPSHTGFGRVTRSVATGANDTGVYIGQSSGVRIDHNVASGNVSGFELENSTHTRMDHNLSHDNTGGLLTFANPGLDVKVNADNRVDHNLVLHNNKANTCLDPNDEVCAVPAGTGILMLATDRNLVDHNTVKGNGSYGIATISQCLLDPTTCESLDVEPNPDGNRILNNIATGNGGSPDPSVPTLLAKDLVWDSSGQDNCWAGNVFGTSFPMDLPPCTNSGHGQGGNDQGQDQNDQGQNQQ
jgi:parallel beta-helix repeat protein